MAQPSIPGTGVGIPRMIYGNDGTDWIAVLVDALGHIQADILSTVLPSDAATQTTLAACLTALQLIDDLRNALGSVNTDDLQVDVKTSALPTDAAKETKQDTMITALQLIDDLRNALGSVATDLVRVASKSGDKIFGFESIVEEALSETDLSAGTNFLTGTAVPAGKIWYITQANVMHAGTLPTRIGIQATGLATEMVMIEQLSPVSDRWYYWAGNLYLQVGDYIGAVVVGATAGDELYLRYAGVQMNAP